MSFNGSGTFSPYTPGNPVVTGTVISSTAFNATIQDIAAGLSNAVTRDGQSPLSANLPAAGRKITGLGAGVVAGDSLRFEQLFSQGAEQDIASAATVDIGGLNTTIARITGTTTITSFGTNYNGPRYVRFADVLLLTHNATTLILPGGANITTAAGDSAIAVPLGNPATGWRVVAYQNGASGPVIFSAGGSERMRIDTSGNVNLQTIGQQFRPYFISATNHAYIAAEQGGGIVFGTGTAGVFERMRIDSGGNVTATGNINAASYNGGQLAGFRNLLINGNFQINQRGYVSGTNVGAANTYTLDRWRVVTSGQNVTFTASGNGNQITAPAGGIEQVIEGINIGGGTYVLNWTGTATATVGGTARTKGEVFTLTAGANVTVRFTGGTVSVAQLEPGTVATPFEHRPYGLELSLCQRYYQTQPVLNLVGYQAAASPFGTTIYLPVSMRATPTATANNIVYVNSSDLTVNPFVNNVRPQVTTTALGVVQVTADLTLSAEL